jgi:hypothetical protein
MLGPIAALELGEGLVAALRSTVQGEERRHVGTSVVLIS